MSVTRERFCAHPVDAMTKGDHSGDVDIEQKMILSRYSRNRQL